MTPSGWWFIRSLLDDVSRGHTLPDLRELIPLMFYLAPPVLFGGVAVGAAWRTWRAERDRDA
ncbi:MAG: hypothetical protein HC828_04290 [Blastochloris sp.]|nr:hypothetical protein [Blastochloris sp.]